MQQTTLKQITIAGAVCTALFAADAWKTKDYTQWTSEETNIVLTDSPWAKQLNVSVPQSYGGQQRGAGQGGGGGYPGGGGGYPGGGGGYPGGGGRGGGIGFPGGGGGMGYPGGGGGHRGGGRNPNDGRAGARSMPVVLRWESALPVQHALLRQGLHSDDDSKPAAVPEQKYYVVAMLGLQLSGPSNTDDYDLGGEDTNKKNSDDPLRSRLLDAAQLIPRGKIPIAAQDVQLEGRNGSRSIRFLFPKTFPLAADEKEVTFHFESRGVKLEHKFKLNDMLYQGKLAL